MLSETDDVNKTRPVDLSHDPEVIDLLEQIRQRGDSLIDQFQELRSKDHDDVIPVLTALRDGQDKVLEILERLRESEP